jgi:hypothetical protein
LYTFCIAIIHFKRSHIENKFRQLDKFTFFNEMFSLQSPFSNWIVNIRLSIIYLVYACRVQSVAPPLVFFLIWQIIIGLSVYYATVNLTLIQGKYLRKKKKYVSFNVTTKIIECQLFSLNIVCSIFFFIKQVILHLKCSVSSTVTKFEHCHYIRCGTI